MPAYNIGGSYVIEGYGQFEGDLYLGNHDSSGWSRLGTECSFGIPFDGSMCELLIANNAFDSGTTSFPPMKPTNALWIAKAQSATGEETYFGLTGYGANVGGHAVVSSFSLIASDRPSFEGTHTLLGAPATFIEQYQVASKCWFVFYNETDGKPYFGGFAGKPLNEQFVDSYSEAEEHIASNPETWSITGAIRLASYNGQDLELNIEPDESVPAGGGGDYDNDSDIIPWAGLPTLGAFNSGFVAVYNPTESEIQAFANWLWGDISSVFSNISKWLSNVMDLIVSLAVVPVEPPQGNTTEIKIGGQGTGVNSVLIANQYMAFDCGTFAVNEYYGNALDYGQYTRVNIFLPYIGVRELKTDEVMGGSVSVRYNIDLVSGSCVAMVRCNRQGLNAVLYQFEGNLSMQIPLVARDFMGMYQSILNAGIGAVGGGMVGGAGGMVSGGASALNIMAMKPQVQHAGNLSSNGGHLGIHTPYLIIERPISDIPANSKMFYGAPSNITAKLSTIKGYTEVESVILDGIECTEEESRLIRQALEEGTIF